MLRSDGSPDRGSHMLPSQGRLADRGNTQICSTIHAPNNAAMNAVLVHRDAGLLGGSIGSLIVSLRGARRGRC